MKKNKMKILSSVTIIAAIVMAVTAAPGQAYSQDGGLSILIQQSPVQGGMVTPEMGVHKYAAGEEVVLTAVPNPGYQFVYWIGDVADSASSRTTAYLDSPKIIIAVFERSEFEFLVTDELTDSQPGGGLRYSPADYSNQGYTGGGGAGDNGWHTSNPEEPEPQDDFPAPPPDNDTNDFPVPEPIPEPATIMLLSLGCLGMVRKRRELTNKNL